MNFLEADEMAFIKFILLPLGVVAEGLVEMP